jgi:hypothetical protein
MIRTAAICLWLAGCGASAREPTLLDETLVMVVTDMGRTPMLNAEAGKDHWPWSSAMLFGAGMQAGRVHGATDDTFQGVPVDLSSGEPSPDGALLEYGHLAAGVLACMGIDPEPWLPGTPPLQSLLSRS